MHQLSDGQHKQVERLAYQLWRERGAPLGSPEDDWFRAEKEFMQRSDSAVWFSSIRLGPTEY